MHYTLEQFHQEYETETQTIKIGDLRLSFLKPKSIDRFIRTDNHLDNFPLWAKLWESSAILCTYLAGLPVVKGQQLLEIGAGLGVTGIVAAALGHEVTITEFNPDALHFIRANAEINGCPHVRIRPLDWKRPELDQRFDLIIGSEVAYKAENIPRLVSLFHTLLAPSGTIVLTEGVRATGKLFMDAVEPDFDIEVRKHQLRSASKSLTVILFKMTQKVR